MHISVIEGTLRPSIPLAAALLTPFFLVCFREMEAHVKKMNNIGKVYGAQKDAHVVSQQLKRNREERKKTKDFLTNEKNLTINKDN